MNPRDALREGDGSLPGRLELMRLGQRWAKLWNRSRSQRHGGGMPTTHVVTRAGAS